jgi:hypothetical protein
LTTLIGASDRNSIWYWQRREHYQNVLYAWFAIVSVGCFSRWIQIITITVTSELRVSLERGCAAGEIATTEVELLTFEVTRTEQAFAFAEAELAATSQRLRGVSG